jgi:hypothetical protein
MIYMNRDRKFVVRFTEEEHKLLRKEAFERNISSAELIRMAIKIFLETYRVK